MYYLQLKFDLNKVAIEKYDVDNQLIETVEVDFTNEENVKGATGLVCAEIASKYNEAIGIFVTGNTKGRYTNALVSFKGDTQDVKNIIAETLSMPVADAKEETPADLVSFFNDVRNHLEWTIEYFTYESGKTEKSKESLLTVGNGFMGVRGALVESRATDDAYPATYVASMYNKLYTEISGRDIGNEDFVNIPNAQYISIKIGEGEIFELSESTVKELYRSLNLKNGTFKSVLHAAQGEYEFEITTSKIANMENPSEFFIGYEVTALNFSKDITFITEIDGSVINDGVERYRSLASKHLEVVSAEVDNTIAVLEARTNESNIQIVLATDVTLDAAFELKNEVADEKVTQALKTTISQGETVRLEKKIVIFTSLHTEGDIKALSLDTVKKMDNTLATSSSKAWETLWNKVDIQVEGDILSQKLLRINAYHLLVSGSHHNENYDASITARGLHGEAYRGHIFWDEIFIMPFYNLHFKESAKSLLMYRYRRLDAARNYAKEYGFKGAMFPWQSGSSGVEETQVIHLNPITGKWGDDYSSLQRHVSLAVAYDVWQYYNLQNDIDFLKEFGAEMLMEVARFWLSKSELDGDKYIIQKVMGPDEFHESYPNTHEGGLKNNTYTNIMVAWLFDLISTLKDEIGADAYDKVASKINFEDVEVEQMQEIKHKLKLEINEDGVLAQYEGYFDLKELDWDYFKNKYGNIYRMDRLLKAEGSSADEYKVAKQADTLMTFYNLDKKNVDHILNEMGYNLPEDYLAKNLEYYLARTSHGSTLSRVVHAQLAEMANDRDLSWSLYREALGSDYNDVQGGTTAEGIHTGVMAATISVAMSTYAGIDWRNETLNIAPSMPDAWKKMSFNIDFRGVNYEFVITHEQINIKTDKDAKVFVFGEEVATVANQNIELRNGR